MEPKFIKKGMYRYNYVEEDGKLHVFAHPLHRLMAQMLDGLVVGLPVYFGMRIFFPAVAEINGVVNGVVGIAFVLYHIIFQIFGDGASIGKNYMGIHVVHKNFNKALEWYQVIWRSIWYRIHGWTLELLYLVMFFNKKSRAVSDMVAHTSVVYHEHKIPKFVHELKDK